MKPSHTHKFAALCGLLLALTGTVAAQNTVVTYQGRLLDGSTPYNGTGQFQFALVTSTNLNHQATATANRTGTFVTTYNLVSGGNGYVTVPAVHITGGGGSGATATATISGGAVTGIVPGSAGGGYTNTPTVTTDPPPANVLYSTFWSNDGTSVNGSQPATAVNVPVSNGLFTVALGDATLAGMAVMDASLFSQLNLQLRIWFNDGVNGFVALDPPQNLTATPYAAVASRLQGGLTVQQNPLGPPNVIGGNSNNLVGSFVVGATIAGGGEQNSPGVTNANQVLRSYGTVSGGYANTVFKLGGVVSGGTVNTSSGVNSVVAGGLENIASGDDSVVSGGYDNVASGENAVVPGGNHNVASGRFSFASGVFAQAVHEGSFVWSDGQQFSSSLANQFSVRARNGIVLAGDIQMAGGATTYHNLSLSGGNSLGYLYGSFPAYADGIHLGYNAYADNGGIIRVRNADGATSRITAGYGFVGVYVGNDGIAPNTERIFADNTGVRVKGTFNNLSDRNAKQDFAPINPAQILEKIGQLPISEWSYKEDPRTRHVGPTAQDFHAAFNIGTDDKNIAPIDEGGISFAAIKGLNDKVEASKSQIAELKAENEELRRQMAELKALIQPSGP